MRYIFSSPYYLNERSTGANKRFECIIYELQDAHEIGVVVVKGQVPKGLNTSVSVYEMPLFIAKSRVLSYVYLNFLYVYLFFGENIVISDFNPIPVSMFFSKKQFQLIHDARIFDNFGRWGNLSAKLMKFQWKYVRNKVVVSKFTKNRLCKELSINPSSIFVSYNGIFSSDIHNTTEEKKEIDLLYVATFEERKNHINLIKALNLIDSTLSVTLLGKDLGLKSEIQRAASKLVNHNVIFLDSVSESELSELYNKSKVFISPSLYEGFGMPILEAYAHGCRVLCSDIYVFHEVLSNKAEFFNPNDVQDISSKIINAHSSTNNNNNVSIPIIFYWENIAIQLLENIKNRNV